MYKPSRVFWYSMNLSPTKRRDSPVIHSYHKKHFILDSPLDSHSVSSHYSYNLSDQSDSSKDEIQDYDLDEYKNLQRDLKQLYIEPFIIKKEEYEIIKVPESRKMTVSPEGFLDSSTSSQFEIEEKHEGESLGFASHTTIAMLKAFIVIFVFILSLFVFWYYYLDKNQ